ncbi:hypothetical protein ERJ75_000321900 [Trypanosoma vivax]|uniref:Uncharacterized protein n=1 Tax=Trypanosoma vivax (strain Y486) TaxID=1055687 RepID=G0UAA7_TRYVY|nr:hypothetical protein TRVL_02899 [Trypanosoma vivax]KAH8617879.1 hypothetical protein ERJ75_000321900 [Trypanosoma vivax]CCC52740.1 conserved hypothetical protein [Trypanosoma vivax Y486]
MRRSACSLARRKWGQRTWSPTATSGGAAPANGISAQEALQIAYRPMPPSNTVEYEEDFGHNMMIHREFISKKFRDRMTFEMCPLAYSDVELSRGKQHLAGVMNRERRGVSIGAAGAPNDQVQMETEVEPNTREVLSARYLFNEKRLQFCDRFQNFFQTHLEGGAAGGGGSGSNVDAGAGDRQYLFSLMEACAIIYGCETIAAREAYYRMFLGLDLDTLEEEEEALRCRLGEARLVRNTLQVPANQGGSKNTSESPQATGTGDECSVQTGRPFPSCLSEEEAFIASVPELSLFEDNEKSSTPPHDGVVGEGNSVVPADAESPPSSSGASSAVHLPDEFEEYAPLYKAYIAHAMGESRAASYDVSTLGSSGVIAERRRWRALMDKIVREDYHTMTELEQMDALVLNEQLHTIKFFDLKVGDAIRDILQLLQRESGSGSSVNRDTPIGCSPNHPERRV